MNHTKIYYSDKIDGYQDIYVLLLWKCCTVDALITPSSSLQYANSISLQTLCCVPVENKIRSVEIVTKNGMSFLLDAGNEKAVVLYKLFFYLLI